MGVPTSSLSMLSLPPVTPGSFTAKGAPALTGILVDHPTGKPGAVQNHPPSPLLRTSPDPGEGGEAIQAGHYVDFKDLLPDNVALRQRVVDTGILGLSNQNLHLREVGDVEMWLHCFLVFVAAKVESLEMRELMAYGQIILILAR